MNDLARPTRLAFGIIARRRFIALLAALLGLALPVTRTSAELADAAWTRGVVEGSIFYASISVPVAPAIALPAVLSIPRVEAAPALAPDPGPATEPLSSVDVQGLLGTRLRLDPRLASAERDGRLVTWAVPRGEERGSWSDAEGGARDVGRMPLVRATLGPGSFTFGLGQKWREGRPRRLDTLASAPVPDMASLLMAQGARIGDDGFLIPTFRWRLAGNLAMDVDVPFATHGRADSWGVVGRLSFSF